MSSAADDFKMKNSFVVHFGVGLWLHSLGIVGPLEQILEWLATWILGSLLDQGILIIDLTLNSIKVAMEENQYKDLAKKAYDKATAKVYTEREKDAIRQQYLVALEKFASVGNGDSRFGGGDRMPDPAGA